MLIKKPQNIFALVDCNNFYASCERVFNPQLKGHPIVVLSNNDGCVIARSNEAKKLGIEMGAPLYQCMYLIKRHNIHSCSSNFAVYGDLSDRVMNTLNHFVPEIEVYSIDEAFLLLNEFKTWDVHKYCQQIRATVKQWVGIPVSIGIAQTKTLAKLANKIAKSNPNHNGVFDLSSSKDIDKVLQIVPVSDLWGIGRQFGKLLRKNYIYTALDLKNAPERWVRKQMGVTGLRTALELKGISCIELDAEEELKKSIVCSRSFRKPITELSELKEATASFISRAAEKLRRYEAAASYVQVYIRTNKFNDRSKQYSQHLGMELDTASSYTPKLITAAEQILEQIYLPGYAYKKAGVTLAGIVDQDELQLNLFSKSEQSGAQLDLMKTFDSINQKWGSNTIQYAATGISKAWSHKRLFKSGNFTTQWAEIPQIYT